MAKNCRVGEVLYFRDRSRLLGDDQPRGPLTVVDILPTPEKETKKGYDFLMVEDESGNVLRHGVNGDVRFGSHLFRRAPEKLQWNDEKSSQAASALLKDRIFDPGITDSLSRLLVLFWHAQELSRRDPAKVDKFRRIFGNEQLLMYHARNCSICLKGGKKFAKKFHLPF